eukprot:119917-Rhodomonas_salina.3
MSGTGLANLAISLRFDTDITSGTQRPVLSQRMVLSAGAAAGHVRRECSTCRLCDPRGGLSPYALATRCP